MHVVHWFLLVSVSPSCQYFDHSRLGIGYLPPLPCAIPALRQTEHSSKTEVTPRELGSSNARACPELHLACRASHHHHQPSRLLCAQGSETSTPHSTWAREKVRQRPCPRTRARLIKSSAYSLYGLTRTDAPFLLSWAGQSQPIFEITRTTFVLF